MTLETKPTRVDDAYERLKEEILENRMPPGFQASEPEFADRLGMSRTPVREALLRLEADGLIELIPRRGARIRPISPDDMREIYEILTALEPEAAAKIAASQPSRRSLKRLDDATTAMERALERDDLDAWARADDRFHRGLLSMHSNRRMSEIINTLFDQAHRARVITLRLRKPPVQSTEDHRRILKHIEAGDAEGARSTFHAHRQRAAKELLDILANFRFPAL